MTYITHHCIQCEEEITLEIKFEEESKNKELHKKEFNCCKCGVEYFLVILEGKSPLCDVIYSENQCINLDADKLLYYKNNYNEKIIEVAFKIGEYDRGVIDDISIGKILDEEFEYNKKISSYKNPDSVHKGIVGENKFKIYLEQHKIDFIFIDQHYDTLSEDYFEKVKRPDYLINYKELNFFVDVKNYKLNNNCFNLDAIEFDKLKKFQDIFNLDVYFIFYELNLFDSLYLIELSTVDNSKCNKFGNIVIDITNMKKFTENENFAESLI